MNITAWQIFERSGKVSDYLAFKSDDETSTDMVIPAEAYNDADKDGRDCVKATQCRRK